MTKSVVVITPTTCDPKLINAVRSVANQTYKNIRHLIVQDGRKFNSNMFDLENQFGDLANYSSILDFMLLPKNTGENGFYGHRIYAGVPHLVNEDYVFFLDQDNTYEPDHVQSLVDVLENDEKLVFAHSLRNIYDKNGKFLCTDDCENLGRWSVWNTPNSHLIDSSAYAFKREFIIQVSQLWHFGYAGDRRFLSFIKDHVAYGSNGRYTMNYYLGGNPTSASPEFFTSGNESQRIRFNGSFPWRSQ